MVTLGVGGKRIDEIGEGGIKIIENVWYLDLGNGYMNVYIYEKKKKKYQVIC